MLERVMRPFQNTKELCLTPFSHRDTAGGRNGGIPESPSMPLCRPVKSDPGRVIKKIFQNPKFSNEFCKTSKFGIVAPLNKKTVQG